MIDLRELVIVIVIIGALSITGLWPSIIRGLRELRGERVDPPPPPETSSADMDICYKLLGLPPSASWEDVEKAYREKAKIHHPDRGGDGDTMRALNDAYAKIRRQRLR